MTRAIATPMTRWQRACPVVLRMRDAVLEYIDAPIDATCATCGHPIEAPGECIRTEYGRVHVACADQGGQYAARGGA